MFRPAASKFCMQYAKRNGTELQLEIDVGAALRGLNIDTERNADEKDEESKKQERPKKLDKPVKFTMKDNNSEPSETASSATSWRAFSCCDAASAMVNSSILID